MAQRQPADPTLARYLDLVDDLMGIDGVTPPPGGSGFGRGSLKYRGKIFAMLVRGSLVLKLPADRVTALIAARRRRGLRRQQGHRDAGVVQPGARVAPRLAGAGDRGAGVRQIGRGWPGG